MTDASGARRPSDEEYCHERLGDAFESALSMYDTTRRVEVLIDDFLDDDVLVGRSVLDVGCGLGYFSERLVQRGAVVTACDLGPTLVERTRSRAGCDGVVADALHLVEQFGEGRFDVVVSSECIEHTPEPGVALREMAGVLKRGGTLAVSTPNLVWQPVVRLATKLKLRPFDGHENFSTARSMRRELGAGGVDVTRVEGLHLFPFQFGMHGLSRWCDRNLQALSPAMINLCVLGVKR